MSLLAKSPEDVFALVAASSDLPDPMKFGLFSLGYGTIPSFASIHSELCVVAPSASAVQAVTSMLYTAYPTLGFNDDDIRRLRGFAQACNLLVADAQRQRLIALGVMPPVASAAAGTPAPAGAPAFPSDASDKELRQAAVASRQWDAFKRATQRASAIPRSEQVSDNDLYKWFTGIVNYGSLSHFPDLMRTKSGASARIESLTDLGNGMSLAVDTVDTTASRVLVANCLRLALMLTTGIVVAFTIIIDPQEDGGLPGDEGFRVTTMRDGTEERTRYFAVNFAETFMRRFTRASIECPHSSLPAIFHNALVRIGDVMGNFQKHPDAACKYVCEELDFIWKPNSDDAPRAGPAASEKPAPKVQTRPGRCHAFDKDGSCPKGQACPYRGAHQGTPSRRDRPKRPREGDYESDYDRGPPARRGDRPRRDDRERDYDRDRDRDHSRERDRPREKPRDARRIQFANGHRGQDL